MTNPWRGEVALTINGEPHVLKLTLGALAALEARVEAGSLVALVERFEGGAFSSADVLALVHAGLLGGGAVISIQELGQADIAGGPMAAARAGAELLARAFIVPGENA
ncbi:gene transfer agent family protein [Aestuariivita sp.]|jgi:hypothetical protein|uniref:gene transfer agent family protein n=1 Tax=Aestuariivita sp. TaxID=1872407 RepID=UPI00216D74C4|nr:gene transfer agent family protein [Aestuariivita sp.]MCE8006596.1 gene transfer agent family protein [Aestuariivita sp.]